MLYEVTINDVFWSTFEANDMGQALHYLSNKSGMMPLVPINTKMKISIEATPKKNPQQELEAAAREVTSSYFDETTNGIFAEKMIRLRAAVKGLGNE